VPNLSQRDRVGTIAGFSADSSSPPTLPSTILEALEVEGLMSARRKAAFGLELQPEEAAKLRPEREAAERWIARRTGGHSN
jgi:hypothetical protein